MSAETYRVKGSSIQSKFDFVEEKFGAAEAASLKAAFREDGLRTVLISSWYPYALYDRLLVELARRYYDSRLEQLTEVGEYSAAKALATTYRAFAQDRDFVRFLDRIATLHTKLYSHGEMTVTMGEDGTSCQIEIIGAPVLADSDFFVAVGFYVGAAKLLGLPNVVAVPQRLRDSFRFDLQWS